MPEFFELAHGQRAHRFLRPDPIPEELVDRILDVATKAPSAQNMQPWEFVVVQDANVRAALGDHAKEVWENFAREYSRPDVEIQIGRERIPARARVAEGDERTRLWSLANGVNKGQYDAYQARTDRDIPVVVLEPR